MQHAATMHESTQGAKMPSTSDIASPLKDNTQSTTLMKATNAMAKQVEGGP